MPANTPTIGYPVHAVDTFSRGQNGFGVTWVDWVAQCGATGRSMTGRFDVAGRARRFELCVTCFPGRDHNACRLGKPREIR